MPGGRAVIVTEVDQRCIFAWGRYNPNTCAASSVPGLVRFLEELREMSVLLVSDPTWTSQLSQWIVVLSGRQFNLAYMCASAMFRGQWDFSLSDAKHIMVKISPLYVRSRKTFLFCSKDRRPFTHLELFWVLSFFLGGGGAGEGWSSGGQERPSPWWFSSNWAVGSKQALEIMHPKCSVCGHGVGATRVLGKRLRKGPQGHTRQCWENLGWGSNLSLVHANYAPSPKFQLLGCQKNYFWPRSISILELPETKQYALWWGPPQWFSGVYLGTLTRQ